MYVYVLMYIVYYYMHLFSLFMWHMAYTTHRLLITYALIWSLLLIMVCTVSNDDVVTLMFI